MKLHRRGVLSEKMIFPRNSRSEYFLKNSMGKGNNRNSTCWKTFILITSIAFEFTMYSIRSSGINGESFKYKDILGVSLDLLKFLFWLPMKFSLFSTEDGVINVLKICSALDFPFVSSLNLSIDFVLPSQPIK